MAQALSRMLLLAQLVTCYAANNLVLGLILESGGMVSSRPAARGVRGVRKHPPWSNGSEMVHNFGYVLQKKSTFSQKACKKSPLFP